MPDFGDLAARALELTVRITVATVVTTLFVLAGRLLRPVVRAVLDRRGRPSYTRVFTGLFRVVVALVGALFALTLAFPSVRVADVLAIFGIVSVAAGFAFKDTFENLLAGVLLLLRDPFQSGDEIVVADREGIVEGVTVRETLVRGSDGHRYFIPNAKVMTDVIEVTTAQPLARQSFRLRLAPDADLGTARSAATTALTCVPRVAPTPAPTAMVVDIVGGEVEVEVRFWTGSDRSTATATRDEAIEAVLRRLTRAGIPLPTPELRISTTAPAGGSHG